MKNNFRITFGDGRTSISINGEKPFVSVRVCRAGVRRGGFGRITSLKERCYDRSFSKALYRGMIERQLKSITLKDAGEMLK